jgi:uncharacterized protein
MKIKKKTLKRILYLIIILIISTFSILIYNKPAPVLSESDHLQFTLENNIQFERQLLEDTIKYTKELLTYYSKNELIYAHLYLPKTKNKLNAIIYMPAAQKTKENTDSRGKVIAELGYAVLIPDVRGIGQTAGRLLSTEQDYQLFLNNEQPIYHKTIYDTLLAAKLLTSLPNINKVIYAGESLGGRTAIIAAAIDNKPVLAVSTSGYGQISNPDKNIQLYLNSINPDFYIAKVPKSIFLHADNDQVIPIAAAQRTFQKAPEPKQLLITKNSTCHGYCDEMHQDLNIVLRELFN